ncbi:9673_t:CDS:1, partial [Racocetra fulgida]
FKELIARIDSSLDDAELPIIPDKLKLLFKGSNDGFGKNVFFKKLKNIEKTILILKIQGTSEIIGGFNPLKWIKLGNFNSKDAYFSATDESFLFSLNNGNFAFSNVACPEHAIYHEKGLGPSFGLDLYMVSGRKGHTWRCYKSDYEYAIRDTDECFQIEDYE